MTLFNELGQLFSDHQLFLVGGSVRDRMLGNQPKDLDFATDAEPEETKALLEGWADAVWDPGAAFGTIAAMKDDEAIEITTFRADGPGRKPAVHFVKSLDEDLRRRDFTINAMAIRIGPDGEGDLQDPFDGLDALQAQTIDTPGMPEITFSDDPLRMLRAARFVSQLGFWPAKRVVQAMEFKGGMIADISAERIAAELDKLLMGEFPQRGLALLRTTGIAQLILPELGSAITIRGNDVTTRWADLLSTMYPSQVQTRLRTLKFSTERVRAVTDLVRLRQHFQGKMWFDVEVRKIITEAGSQLYRLQALLDDQVLNERVGAVLAAEGFPMPFLTGAEVMDILDIAPGPLVGTALQWLWKLRLEMGPMSHTEVEQALCKWASVAV